MESTVIYVAFGGQEPHRSPPPPERDEAPSRPRSGQVAVRHGFRVVRGAHGLLDMYTTLQAARLLGIPEGKIRWWRRCGLVVPSGREGAARMYTFPDLVSLKAARELTGKGLPAARIRRAIHELRADLGSVSDPLTKLRVFGNDRRLVIDREGRETEAETGQILIDFSISSLARQVDRTVPFDPSGRRDHGTQGAWEWLMAGSDLEQDPARHDEAEAAYRKALELEPTLASAATNLGNLLFRKGRVREAEDLYRQAIHADPDQPQAYYNLGFLKLEQARSDLAIVFFHKALSLDPGFADARFNLAVALEREGRMREARKEFIRFLSLDPASPWAGVARMHVDKIDGGEAR